MECNDKKEIRRLCKVSWLTKLATAVTIVYVILALATGVQHYNCQRDEQNGSTAVSTDTTLYTDKAIEQVMNSNSNEITQLTDKNDSSSVPTEENVYNDVGAETKQKQEEETTQPVEELPQYKYCDIPLSHELQDFVHKTAEKYNIPAGLLFAVMDVESDFRIDVISSTDDYGLCQINTINHDWLNEQLGLDNMLDPYQNITACAYIYSDLLEDNDGDINLAAMCYNCGRGGAAELWDEGIWSTDYSRKIVNAYNELYSSFD